MELKYPNLFSKLQIGGLELKNRVAMTAMGVSLGGENYAISKDYINYVTERARGGLGLYITQVVLTDEDYGVAGGRLIGASRDSHIAGWRRLADSVHKYDCKIFAQLWHPGAHTFAKYLDGKQPIGPGNVFTGAKYPEIPRMMTVEEIHEITDKFAAAAKRVQSAGVDGVEIHGAHTYLLHQFLSEEINNRTDEYGGSFENRMRIFREVVDKIRAKCGPRFPISVRISAVENMPNGYGIETGIKIAKALEEMGVDMINVSNGTSESSYMIQETNAYAEGWKIDNGRRIRENVNIPVLAVSVIRTPSYAEELIRDKVVDMVGITRGQFADPEWCNKARAGEDLAIRPCLSCLYCFEESGQQRGARCAVNACAGREEELCRLKENGDNRLVVVIGGGPAGLEAARVLSLRKFRVILFEKSDKLGGTLLLADKLLHKERIDKLIENLEYQARKAGVEIRMNTPADVEEIKLLNPYAVFVATGSTPLFPPFEGADNGKCFPISDYLTGKVSFTGKKVAVIGGGNTGCETAERLCSEGNEATIVEMREDVGLDMYAIFKQEFARVRKDMKINTLVNAKLQAITDKGIRYEDVVTGETREYEADAVIVALGSKPNNSLVPVMEKEFFRVSVLGDAVRGGRIVEAIRDGYTKAFVLE